MFGDPQPAINYFRGRKDCVEPKAPSISSNQQSITRDLVLEHGAFLVMDRTPNFLAAMKIVFQHDEYYEQSSVNAIVVPVNEKSVDRIVDILVETKNDSSNDTLKPTLISKLIESEQKVDPPTPLDFFGLFQCSYWVENADCKSITEKLLTFLQYTDIVEATVGSFCVMSSKVKPSNATRLLASLYSVFDASLLLFSTCFLQKVKFYRDIWAEGMKQEYQSSSRIIDLVRHCNRCIEVYDSETFHAPAFALVNSSGTGKTRNVLELVNHDFDVLYLLRRRGGESGVPKMNPFQEEFFDYASRFKPENQDSLTQFIYHLLLYSIYSCAKANGDNAEPFLSEKYATLISRNLNLFANRQITLDETIDVERKVLKWLVDRKRPFIIMLDECHVINDIRHHYIGLVETMKHVLRFLNQNVSYYKMKQKIDEKRYGFVLGILADTLYSAVKSSNSSPSNRLDTSIRVNPLESFELSSALPTLEFPVFIDIASMGCLTLKVCENDTSFLLDDAPVPNNANTWKNMILSDSGSFENDNSSLSRYCLWFFTQGRPLWGTWLLQTNEESFIFRAKHLITFARHKLTCCDYISLVNVNRPIVSLACCGVRLGLEFDSGNKFSEPLVEGYMAYCIDVFPEIGGIHACYISEPALVEAACAMIWESIESVNKFLTQISEMFSRRAFFRDHVDAIVCQLVTLLARDVLVKQLYPPTPFFIYSRGFTVRQFLTALHGDQCLSKMDTLFNDQKTVQKKLAWELLLDGVMTFSHFTPLATIPNNSLISCMLNQCVAGFMSTCNPGYDCCCPVLLPDGRKTLIFFQIKTRESEYKRNTSDLSKLNKNMFFHEQDDDGAPYLVLRYNYGFKGTRKPLEVGIHSMNNDDGFYISAHGLNSDNYPFLESDVLNRAHALAHLNRLLESLEQRFSTRAFLNETDSEALSRLKDTDPGAFDAAKLPGPNVPTKLANKLMNPESRR